MNDIRYYMGKIECEIMTKGKRKALVSWNESGVIGNKSEGYKNVASGIEDIVPIRLLWRKKND
ncbi:hypothetical protein LCGC14_2964190 [marine sediment metagenome]|uniref:Uncharacterized protein n=1 Tax=marine sediment metagenome TaxID=412755 RepID=A0A0F8XYT2_9ZZZZ